MTFPHMTVSFWVFLLDRFFPLFFFFNLETLLMRTTKPHWLIININRYRFISLDLSYGQWWFLVFCVIWLYRYAGVIIIWSSAEFVRLLTFKGIIYIFYGQRQNINNTKTPHYIKAVNWFMLILTVRMVFLGPCSAFLFLQTGWVDAEKPHFLPSLLWIILMFRDVTNGVLGDCDPNCHPV